MKIHSLTHADLIKQSNNKMRLYTHGDLIVEMSGKKELSCSITVEQMQDACDYDGVLDLQTLISQNRDRLA